MATIAISQARSRVHSLLIQLIAAVVSRNWTEVARYGDLDNWREILAALVTYAGPEDFAPLCGKTPSLFLLSSTFYLLLTPCRSPWQQAGEGDGWQVQVQCKSLLHLFRQRGEVCGKLVSSVSTAMLGQLLVVCCFLIS